jgi:hypothetical protein
LTIDRFYPGWFYGIRGFFTRGAVHKTVIPPRIEPDFLTERFPGAILAVYRGIPYAIMGLMAVAAMFP